MALGHVCCEEDGWGHLVAIIGCHGREIVGWGCSLRGRAREAERALRPSLCLRRHGTTLPRWGAPRPAKAATAGLPAFWGGDPLWHRSCAAV